ncbi:hypothetical protein F5Y06DRAFT_291309 [Hypoxylon sp. FL0890]|nr:hypothetical protein F5Y06DRAFT_291309 [Hypoxylon sp. FL0890]
MGTILAPSWATRTHRNRLAPQGWRLYIVARIDGVLRPLAAGEYITENFGGSRRDQHDLANGQAVLSCSCVLNVLSDPANRLALESERAAAVDYYREAPNTPRVFPPRIPLDGVVYEFPFTETCLFLGATAEVYRNIFFRPLPLATVYRDGHDPSLGMVLLDITDLDNLRYGIVSSQNSSQPKDGDLEDVEANEEQRMPSAIPFKDLCQFADLEEEAQRLEGVSVINKLNIDFTWPSESPIPRLHKRLDSLCHQIIRTLIQSTLVIESFDMYIFDLPRCIPHFKRLLQECLREHPGHLNHPRSVGQLIALAFEGDTHLDLVRFKGFSLEAIEFALQTGELNNVKSISIYSGSTRDSIIEIIDAVSKAPSLRELYLQEPPMRKDDEGNFAFIKTLSMRPQFFKRIKVMITSAFSATLNCRLWSDLERYPDIEPPSDIFPVQHMFFRLRQSRFYPDHTYHGNGLLGAEAFAARLLRCLSLPDHDSFSLCVGPSSLEDLSRLEVNPVTVFCTNRVPKLWSWTVLVIEGFGVNEKGETYDLPEFKAIRYAFVRLRVDTYDECLNDDTSEFAIKPAQVDVVGIKGFLKATAPHVDPALVDRSLAEAVENVRKREGRTHAAPGLGWVSVLTHKEACAFLNGFLNDMKLGVLPRGH